MTKHSIIAFLCCLSFTATQAQCRLDKDEKDQVSGNRTREVIYYNAWRHYNPLKLNRTGDVYKLGLKILLGTSLTDIFPKDRDILIKLEDGAIITLHSDEDAPPQQAVSHYQAVTIYYPLGTVTRNEFMKLSRSPIVSIQTKINGTDMDMWKIFKRQAGKIMQSAGCMLEH